MQNSKILKILSYILIPVILTMLIINFMCIIYISNNEDFLNKDDYMQTTHFASRVYNKINKVKYYIASMVMPYSDGNSVNIIGNVYGENPGFDFLFINKSDNTSYSNITTFTNDIEKEKNKLKNEKYYLFYNDKIDTNINNSDLKNEGYIDPFNNVDFEIYIGFSENIFNADADIYFEKLAFEYVRDNGDIVIYTIPVYIVLEILLVIYLLWSIGRKKGEENIYQTKFDKWPIEIILGIGLIYDFFWFYILAVCDITGLFYNYGSGVQFTILLISIVAIILASMYTVTAVVGSSFIKKLKTGTLINTSLTYIICKKIFTGIREIFKTFFSNLNTNLKFLGMLGALLLITFILCGLFNGFGVFLAIIMYGIIIYFIIKKLSQFSSIKSHLKGIFYGNTVTDLDLAKYDGELKEIAGYINGISNGLEEAVNERLKSERLKTELITNVSHDIKTPLTSIINYVDLLKQEDIQNEKIKEYVEVLDAKSQRLRKLIEDLVEASKVSSGNIKLDMQKINLVELINQTVGEFSDKFAEKDLSVIINTNSKEEYNIQADTRYMYRVVENVFSNIYKYALEGSRVYIDMNEKKDKITLEIKNISKEPLNITEDELMERFVRGDRSRNTEGSGLGLSIAKSLTELQNGEFNIVIDGDLFKVEISYR